MNAQAPTAIAVAVVRQGDSVLIGPRPEGTPLAGYWEFPGGKIRPGESPTDAAARECLEETGLHVRVSAPLAIVEHQYDHETLCLHFLDAVAVDPQSPPQPPFRWTPIADLTQYRFPPANAAVLDMLTPEVR